MLFNYRHYDRLGKRDVKELELTITGIDKAAYLVKEIGNCISEKIITTLIAAFNPNFDELMDELAVVFKPTLIIDDIELYLSICNKLFFNSISCWCYGEVDTGCHDLDEIYNYIKDIYFEADYKYYAFVNHKLTLFIFACLHYYGISNEENINNALDIVSSDDFYEKLELRGCKPFDFLGNCKPLDAKYILDNFHDIFKKETRVIK